MRKLITKIVSGDSIVLTAFAAALVLASILWLGVTLSLFIASLGLGPLLQFCIFIFLIVFISLLVVGVIMRELNKR